MMDIIFRTAFINWRNVDGKKIPRLGTSSDGNEGDMGVRLVAVPDRSKGVAPSVFLILFVFWLLCE